MAMHLTNTEVQRQSPSRLRGGEVEADPGADRRVGQPDAPAVRLDDRAGDGQPEAGARGWCAPRRSRRGRRR